MRYAVPSLVLPVIQHFEQGPGGGPALTAYLDPNGYWTNGWGHRCAPDQPVITESEANIIADQDLQGAAVYLNQSLGPQITASLSDGQFAALTDFVFSEGAGNFQHSTLHAVLMAGRNDLVPGELRKWIYVHKNGQPVALNGLKDRREAEVSLWTTGSWSSPAPLLAVA